MMVGMTTTTAQMFTIEALTEWRETDERASSLDEGHVYMEYGDNVNESVFITHVGSHGDTVLITGANAVDGSKVERTHDIDEVVCRLVAPKVGSEGN